MDDLPVNKLKTADAFFSYSDNQLHYGCSQLIKYINFHSITRDKLIIPDALLLNNRDLENILLNTKYYKLLEEGIFVPALRENVSGFTDLFNDQNKRGAKDRCTNPEYPKLIDKAAQSVMWYEGDVISKNYTDETKNLIKNYYFIQKLGLTKYSYDLTENIDKIVEENGVLTRTDIWNLSEKNEFSAIQDNIKKLGTTIYIPNIPRTYNINPVYPNQFAEYFKNVYITPYCGVPEKILDPDIEDVQRVVRIPSFSDLTPESIKIIRETDDFREYIKITNGTYKTNDERLNGYYDYLMELSRSIAAAIKKPKELQSVNTEIKFTQKQYAMGEKVAKIIGHLPIPLANYAGHVLEIILTCGGNKLEKSLKMERSKICAEAWLMLTQVDVGDTKPQFTKT